MALHLERHPGVHAAFNFAPSLIAQLEHARTGGQDTLFELLGRASANLSAAERAELQSRARMAPPWARQRWPQYEQLIARTRPPAVAADPDLLRLSVFFLLAWLDPLLLAEPVAARIEAAAIEGRATLADRDALLALHAEILARVLPAYRALADRGQIELTCSPAFHPILPLLIDVRAGRRSRPDLPVPIEELAAPEDARWQIEEGLAIAERALGRRPQGMWPSEGSVSPEAAELLAGAGVRWIATDEQVLWRSRTDHPPRAALYQPWTFATAAGDIALFFRDHELSDRIGFVYSTWPAEKAVADFLAHLRRIAEAHHGAGLPGRPVVSVILDGENCWEHFADDGRPFLEALYDALEAAPDIRTRTPSQVLEEDGPRGRLEQLHTGSWIDADFHIWAGHPEKNRAWDLVARARAALVAAGATRASHPDAWESLSAAEGSDWFWWFGDDHFTADKALFDSLFRAHVQGAYEKAGLDVPGSLALPVAGRSRGGDQHFEPTAMLSPTIDGRLTRFFEWHGSGRWQLGTGGSAMHRVTAPVARALYYAFDAERLYLRVDPAEPGLLSAEGSLVIEVLAPHAERIDLASLAPGRRALTRAAESAPCGEAAIAELIEMAIPFEALGVAPRQTLELLLHVERASERLESLPPGTTLRIEVPGPEWDVAHWSA